jgi:phosphoglycerate dehydrogenase-like enzyme
MVKAIDRGMVIGDIRLMAKRGGRRVSGCGSGEARTMKVVGGVFSVPSWMLPAEQVERIRAALPHAEVAHATTADELLHEIRDADAALLTRIDAAQFAAATRLRWIHSAAAGVGGLLLPEVRRSDVIVTNSRGIHGTTMAEHVIGVTIALLRDLPAAVRRQITHEWAYIGISSIKTLRGRRMAVVGLGAIGSEVARAASALGMHVSAVRRHPGAPRPDCVASVHGSDELAEVLPLADVVVLAAPLTPETRALIGSRELRLMKPTAIRNVAREAMDEKALVKELSGHDAGGARCLRARAARAVQSIMGPAERAHHSAHVRLPRGLLGRRRGHLHRKRAAPRGRAAAPQRGGQGERVLALGFRLYALGSGWLQASGFRLR